MSATPAISPEVLDRYREFFERPAPGQILVTVPPYTCPVPPRPDSGPRRLDAWRPFEDAERMAEQAVADERHFLALTRDVGSDYVPSVNPSYGIGLCSAVFSNAPVLPGVDTSWIRPAMEALDDLRPLRFDPDGPWFDFMRRFMRRAAELCEGDYFVTPYAAMAPSDLANALRGNDLFTDLYDDPDGVRRLLAACVDATLRIHRELLPLRVEPEGGFVAGGMWLPGTGLFLSEDGADLCSPDAYREFFGPATRDLVRGLGGAYIHHHARGWAIHPQIAGTPGLRFLEFSWDPKCPRPVDHLDELSELSLKVPLQTRCTLADLPEVLPRMGSGRYALMVNVGSPEEGREAVRLVRRHSTL